MNLGKTRTECSVMVMWHDTPPFGIRASAVGNGERASGHCLRVARIRVFVWRSIGSQNEQETYDTFWWLGNYRSDACTARLRKRHDLTPAVTRFPGSDRAYKSTLRVSGHRNLPVRVMSKNWTGYVAAAAGPGRAGFQPYKRRETRRRIISSISTRLCIPSHTDDIMKWFTAAAACSKY